MQNGEQNLTPEKLARFYYKYPLNAFPILDDAYNFSGLLLKRYVLNNLAEFKSLKTTVKDIIDKYVYYPNEGEIVRMIFGDKKIQEFPVFNRRGYLMGIWELSSFFRIFDKLPYAAYLNFRSIFNNLPLPVFVTDGDGKLMTFNIAMVQLSGIEQDDNRNMGRKIARLLPELGWTMDLDKGSGHCVTPSGDYHFQCKEIILENEQSLLLYTMIPFPDPLEVEDEVLTSTAEVTLTDAVEKVEKQYVIRALKQNNGNVSHAAEQLAVPRQTLQYKIVKYGLRPELFS